MTTYRVTFNEKIETQDFFIPSHIEVEHEYIDERTAEYTTDDPAFEAIIENSPVVETFEVL